jgi:hypothetical protein
MPFSTICSHLRSWPPLSRLMAERLRLAHDRAQSRMGVDRELAETRRKIVEAGGDLALLVPRLNALSRQQRDAEERLRTATNGQPRVLHAEATDRYRQKVAPLRQMSQRARQIIQSNFLFARKLLSAAVATAYHYRCRW